MPAMRPRKLFGFLLLCVLLVAGTLCAGSSTTMDSVMVKGYPEYHFQGQPFFPYAAAFYYHRIPADLWPSALVKLKETGFNTLDLYVIWNWHQPTEDVLDLDGHTNPRRNLKRLLELARAMDFKVILRPGPYTFNEWRNGGYPDWLLRKAPQGMSDAAIREGWFPIPSSLQYLSSERAAEMWLSNGPYWKATENWIHALWKVAAPFSAAHGGNIVAVQIDDDLAIGYHNYNGPNFWKYIARLQRTFRMAGVDVPLFSNAAFMRVTGEASAPPEAMPLWIIGQWYLRGGVPRLEEDDVAGLQYAVDTLRTQSQFPAMMIEFNTNQYAGPLKTRAQIEAPPRDLLLAARVLYQNGLRGMTIYPPIDTIFPAGWEFPPANYYYTWESALDVSLRERPERAAVLRRDGRLITGMGRLLAATHPQSNFGLLDAVSSYPQADLDPADMDTFARRLVALQQLAYQTGLQADYVDPEHQPDSVLGRYRALILPGATFHKKSDRTVLPMSASSQRALLKYVQNGGTLIIVPQLPDASDLLSALHVSGASPIEMKQVSLLGVTLAPIGSIWGIPVASATPLSTTDASGRATAIDLTAGKGHVFILGFDFFTWVKTAPVPTVGQWKPAAEWSAAEQDSARQLLRSLLGHAGVVPPVSTSPVRVDSASPYLYVTAAVANDGTGYGFASVTNWSDGARRADLNIAIPGAEPMALASVHVAGRDSIILPFRIPLNRLVGRNAGFAANEQLLSSTAELVSARYGNSAIELNLYAPAEAQIKLALNRPPYGNCESDGKILNVVFDRDKHVVTIAVPASDQPDGMRTVKIPYTISQPMLTVSAPAVVRAGENVKVQVTVRNRGDQQLEGSIALEAPAQWEVSESQPLHAGAGAQMLPLRPLGTRFDFTVGISGDAVAGSEWPLVACIDVGAQLCSDPVMVRVGEIRWHLTPIASFPIRSDVQLETSPPLWALRVPGSERFELQLENPFAASADVRLNFEGANVQLEPTHTEVKLAPGATSTVTLSAWPRPSEGQTRTPTGVYPFRIHIQEEGAGETVIPVELVGVRVGDSIAYRYDFDRDGFDDVVLENEYLRLVIMPNAGGRAFALIDKQTGRNALNTVGGLRDAFSFHPPVYVFHGADLRRPVWRWPELRLNNRDAAVRIVNAAGTSAAVELSYDAPDVAPKGARVVKRIELPGGSRVVKVVYEITPLSGSPEQRFRAGAATSVFDSENKGSELLLPSTGGVVSESCATGQTRTLRAAELLQNWVAASYPATGDTFGIFWKGAPEMTFRCGKDSTLFELVSRPLDTATPYHFSVGYYFSHEGMEVLRHSYDQFVAEAQAK